MSALEMLQSGSNPFSKHEHHVQVRPEIAQPSRLLCNGSQAVPASGLADEEAEDADMPFAGTGDSVLLDALDGGRQAAGAADEVKLLLALLS